MSSFTGTRQTPALVTVLDQTAGQADLVLYPAGVYVNGVLQVPLSPPLQSPSERAFVSGVGGSATLATNPRYLDVISSSGSAATRTLPTPANSYTGQLVTVVQEGSNVFTVGVPTGVTVFMQSGASTVSSKTATNWTSGANGTSATLVCTATNGSTTSTWCQIGGVGIWS